MFKGTADDLWYFHGRTVVMRWDGTQWNRYDTDKGIHETFCVDDELWGVQLERAGVYRTTLGAWNEVLAPEQGINSARAWIGSPTFGYNIHEYDAGVRRISQFDGSKWTTVVDDTGVMHDVWGWTGGPGGIVVGTSSSVFLIGD